MQISLPHFLVVGALLFSLGLVTVATRRNAVGVLMGIELILNGANVNFAAFNHYVVDGVTGQIFALFVIVLAAAEAAVGLAIVLAVYQTFKSIDVRSADLLRE
jgi:NADH-quinone oxidoreductase subunit K